MESVGAPLASTSQPPILLLPFLVPFFGFGLELRRTDEPFRRLRDYNAVFWPAGTVAHRPRITLSKLGVFGGSFIGSSKLAS